MREYQPIRGQNLQNKKAFLWPAQKGPKLTGNPGKSLIKLKKTIK